MFGFFGSFTKDLKELTKNPAAPPVHQPQQRVAVIPPGGRQQLPNQPLPELAGEDNEVVAPNPPCCICMVNAPKVTLVPCGHLCLCIECYNQFRRDNRPVCPNCRQQITLAVKTYQ